MAGLIRQDHGKSPAPVAESWKRIEAWLDEHLPVLKKTLRPGISKKDLAKFERLVGRSLPEDVRESWLIHDGQRPIPDELSGEDADPGQTPENLGLLFGHELMPLLDGDDCLTTRSALGNWKDWAEMVDEAERGEDDGTLDELGEDSTSSPEGSIRRLYASRAWIPLAEIHDSDHFGIDLDPGPNGAVGQVINFGRDQEAKHVLATSWAQFLEDVADELEAGNFVIDMGRKYKDFCMKEPRTGRIYQNLEAWSEAKVAPDSEE